jgi:hypothetical protein
MNRLHEGGIAAEGVPRGRLISLEQVAEVILLGLESGEWLPGHVVFEGTPDPLQRVQFRAIGRQEHQAPVRREGEPRGRMGPTVVQHEEVQAVGEGLREGVDEALEPLGVQRGPLQKEPLTRGRLHRAIDVANRVIILFTSVRT